MKKNVLFCLFLIFIAFGMINCNSENQDTIITFDLDGGNVNGNTNSIIIPVKSGESIIQLPNPTKEDSTFSGWFTEKNGFGSEFDTSSEIKSNITVFAKWTFLNEYLKLAYDWNYQFPEGFYFENNGRNSVYYVNTVSTKPSSERKPIWIELHTNDKNEAKNWSILSDEYSSVSRNFIHENETVKYFEFIWEDASGDYALLSRIHKSDYFIPIFDKFKLFPLFQYFNEDIENRTIGIYNGTLTVEKVKEFIEYIWVNSLLILGKVVESTITEKDDYFELNIESLEMVYGDWGINDMIYVNNNIFLLNKNTRVLTFVDQINIYKLIGKKK